MTRFPNRRKKRFRHLGALLICSMVFQVFPAVSSVASNQDTDADTALSRQEEEALVAQGVQQYEQGERDQARKTAESLGERDRLGKDLESFADRLNELHDSLVRPY